VKTTIVEIPPSKSVYSRWGEPCSVSNVKLTDDTGSIRMSIWNDRIPTVHIDDRVEVKNGYVYTFQGELQLRLRKHSTLSILA
jgi:replication factor A1